jgi:hypothetical protein
MFFDIQQSIRKRAPRKERTLYGVSRERITYGCMCCWLFVVVNSCVIPRGEIFKSDIGNSNLQTLICGLRVEVTDMPEGLGGGSGEFQLVAVWETVRKLCSEQGELGGHQYS